MACFASRPVAHPFFRFPAQEFAPLMRILDDAISSPSDFQIPRQGSRRRHAPSFHPRFDIQEDKQVFHVQGELPGVEQKDIDIEFTDANTLVIKGRRSTEYRSDGPSESETTPAASAAVEDVKGKGKAIEGDTGSEQTDAPRAPSPHQATVEDEDEFVDVSESEAAKTPATDASETPTVQEVAKSQSEAPPAKSTGQPSSKYIIRERSVGEFRRSFTFPGRVDQNAVKASLKNGILSIVVPKAEIPRRTITVQ